MQFSNGLACGPLPTACCQHPPAPALDVVLQRGVLLQLSEDEYAAAGSGRGGGGGGGSNSKGTAALVRHGNPPCCHAGRGPCRAARSWHPGRHAMRQLSCRGLGPGGLSLIMAALAPPRRVVVVGMHAGGGGWPGGGPAAGRAHGQPDHAGRRQGWGRPRGWAPGLRVASAGQQQRRRGPAAPQQRTHGAAACGQHPHRWRCSGS